MSMRRWFQIHLSTAIGMSFVAAVLLGMNFLPPRVLHKTIVPGPGTPNNINAAPLSMEFKYQSSGWPFTTVRFMILPIEDAQTFWRADKIDEWNQQTLERSIARGLYEIYPAGRFFDWRIVAWNSIVCTALTLGSCFGFEYLVRRRKLKP